jgi:hypothetical protein
MFKPIRMAAVTVGAALYFVVSGFPVQAQQFSADLVRIDANSAEPRPAGKLNVADSKVHITTSELPTGFFLVLRDADAAYFVRPAQKVFMDAKQSSPLTQVFVIVDPDDPCRRWQDMAKIAGAADGGGEWRCERVGDDIVRGRRAIKYRAISPQGRQHFGWIDRQLHFPVRLQSEDGTITELANIEEAAQPEGLFLIPAGYRKFDPQLLIERIKQSDVWVEQPH